MRVTTTSETRSGGAGVAGTRRRSRHVSGAVLALAVVAFGAASMPVGAQRPTPMPADSAMVRVIPVQGQVHMVVTGGGNIAVQVGEVGAVLVDSGNAEASPALLAEVAKLSHMPIRFLINTSAHPGKLGNNKAVFDVGQAMPGVNQSLGMSVISHQKTLDRLVAGDFGAVPDEQWPFNTFFGPKKTLHVNDEVVEILHVPAATTDGDVMVHFRRSDVLATGDFFSTQSYPVWRPEHGGSLQGIIDGLNRVIDITVPKFNMQGGTMVIPGHGRISEESDVVEVRDMLTIVRDRVALMIKEGRTVEQVIAAKPSLEYDGIYGTESGPSSPQMFLTAVYNELKPQGGR